MVAIPVDLQKNFGEIGVIKPLGGQKICQKLGILPTGEICFDLTSISIDSSSKIIVEGKTL